MDNGVLFEHEFEVLPTRDGGFIVTLGRRFSTGEISSPRYVENMDRWAFTSVGDLMRWMLQHASITQGPKAFPPGPMTEPTPTASATIK